MPDQPEIINRPEPYVPKDPDDIIRAGDWNELQIQTREEIRNHTHTGDIDGTEIPREGIKDKAINGLKIDPETELLVKSLKVSGKLEVVGEMIARDVQHHEGDVLLGNEDSDSITVHGVLRSAHSSGALEIDDALHVTGPLSIGETDILEEIKRLDTDKVKRTGDVITGALTIKGNVGMPDGKAQLTVDASLSSVPDWNTAAFRNAAIGHAWSHIHWGSTGDWYIRSAAKEGKVIIQDYGGNVGIGTSAPRAKLHVKGGDKCFAWDGDHAAHGYIRIGNMQICWGSGVWSGTTHVRTFNFTFPAPFKSVPQVTNGINAVSSGYAYAVYNHSISSTKYSGSIVEVQFRPATASVTMNYIAIGVWQ